MLIDTGKRLLVMIPGSTVHVHVHVHVLYNNDHAYWLMLCSVISLLAQFV